jgi:proline iminopeptidase
VANIRTARGIPVVVLHGGPGSGTSDWYERWFDPQVHHLTLFDQRNCGRSQPHASTPAVDLSRNTTAELIRDIERLRELSGVERWMVAGASWGSTLALAYAQAHPSRVSGVVLVAVCTTTDAEVDWITRGMAGSFPDAWGDFAAAARVRDGERLVDGYLRQLMSPDAAVHQGAADAWCRWEQNHVSRDGQPVSDPRYDDPRFRLAFARLVTHYWAHAAFLPDGALMAGMERLAGIPASLVHGADDRSSRPQIARDVHHA